MSHRYCKLVSNAPSRCRFACAPWRAQQARSGDSGHYGPDRIRSGRARPGQARAPASGRAMTRPAQGVPGQGGPKRTVLWGGFPCGGLGAPGPALARTPGPSVMGRTRAERGHHHYHHYHHHHHHHPHHHRRHRGGGGADQTLPHPRAGFHKM